MSTIAIDGLNEETFRRSIESRLRQGKPGDAVDKLRALLAPYAGPGKILPERFLTVRSSDLVLHGWDGLADAIVRHEQPGRAITALSIAFGWPGEEVPQPDAEGCLTPLVETAYFTDEAFPFSQSAREDLLDGYSYHGCTWADQSAATDNALTLSGIDDLHGALAALEIRLLNSEAPDDEEIRAGSLGACLLSALLVQVVTERVQTDGLPRPLCVLAGSNGVYPYFDAPVAGLPADLLDKDEDEVPLGQGVPGPRYSSLLVTGIPRARKRAVLVLDESAEETAQRNASLRGMTIAHDSAPPVPPEAEVAQLPEGITPAPGGPLLTKKAVKPAWDFRDLLGEPEDEDPEGAAETTDSDDDWPSASPIPSAPENDWPEVPQARLPEVPPADSPQPPAQRDWTDYFEPRAPSDAEPAHPLLPVQEPIRPELAEPVAAAQTEAPLELSELAPPEPDPAALDQDRPAPRFPRLPAALPPEPGFALIEPSVQERLQSLVAPRVELVPPETAPELVAEPLAEAPQALAEPSSEMLPEGPVWPLGIGWLEDAEAAAQIEPAPSAAPEPAGLWSRLRSWVRRRG